MFVIIVCIIELCKRLERTLWHSTRANRLPSRHTLHLKPNMFCVCVCVWKVSYQQLPRMSGQHRESIVAAGSHRSKTQTQLIADRHTSARPYRCFALGFAVRQRWIIHCLALQRSVRTIMLFGFLAHSHSVRSHAMPRINYQCARFSADARFRLCAQHRFVRREEVGGSVYLNRECVDGPRWCVRHTKNDNYYY